MSDQERKKEEVELDEEKNVKTEESTEAEVKKEFNIEDIKDEMKKIEQQPIPLQIEDFSKETIQKKVKELETALIEREEVIKNLLAEHDKVKNRTMHLQAEFENAQKRWDKSRSELRIQNTASVLKSFLPLYDSFKKAIDSNTVQNEKEIEILTQFFNQFLNICKSYQAEPMQVNCGDSFDYSLHEALTSIEKEDLPENSIVDIIQEGWKMAKDVLRYAKVVIAKKPKPPAPEPEPKKEETKKADDKKDDKEDNTIEKEDKTDKNTENEEK